MTRESDRPLFDASPAKRTSRLVARKPVESRTTIFNHSPSPKRTSMGRSSTALKGSITISGSLKVHSPRAPRPTILPFKQEASTQTSDIEKNVVSIGPTCKMRTEIRYSAEELRQLQPRQPPVTSPTKTVRFAEDTSALKRDPAIIYCAVKQAKDLPLSNPSVPIVTQPSQEAVIVTLQQLLTLDKNDREKLQNILHALNNFNEIPQALMAPVARPNVTIPPVAMPPILTPTSSCNTPIELRLNPEAPAFRDLSKVKSTISSPKQSRKESHPVESSNAKEASATLKAASPLAKAASDDFLDLKWKMSPGNTWGPKVRLRQLLTETRRNTRPEDCLAARPSMRPSLTLNIPVESTASMPTPVVSKHGIVPDVPTAPQKRHVQEDSRNVLPRETTPVVPTLRQNNYMPEVPNWSLKQSQTPVWLNTGPPSVAWPPPVAWPPFMPIPPCIHQMPPAFPFGFQSNTHPPPPPYMSTSVPAYCQSPFESNFDDIQDYPDAPGGRVGQALPEFLGDRILGKFMAKYPMTGTPPLPAILPHAHQSANASMKLPPIRARTKQQNKSSAGAAKIQQQLEELILEKKEKEALAKIEKNEEERRTKWQTGSTATSQVA